MPYWDVSMLNGSVGIGNSNRVWWVMENNHTCITH